MELLVAFERGDQRAFDSIYNTYWPVLYNEARKVLKDNELAKDAVQDVFTKVLLIQTAKEGHIKSLRGFLFTSLRNWVLNSFNHEKVKDSFIHYVKTCNTNEFAQIEVTIEQAHFKLQNEKRLEVAISNLPPKMRTAFKLAKKDQLSYKEIAIKMGSSEETIKKHIHTALSILRSKLLFLI